MNDISILLNATGGADAFDPADRLGLSPKQRTRLEQLIIASRNVRDPNGLLILHNLDWWIAAQMVRSMFDATGAPRDVFETALLEPWK